MNTPLSEFTIGRVACCYVSRVIDGGDIAKSLLVKKVCVCHIMGFGVDPSGKLMINVQLPIRTDAQHLNFRRFVPPEELFFDLSMIEGN